MPKLENVCSLTRKMSRVAVIWIPREVSDWMGPKGLLGPTELLALRSSGLTVTLVRLVEAIAVDVTLWTAETHTLTRCET